MKTSHPVVQFALILAPLALLAAADTPTAATTAATPAWMAKRVAEWSERDAWEVLVQSPWAKQVVPAILGSLTKNQRLEAGNFAADPEGHKGVGLGNFSLFSARGAPDPATGRATKRGGRLSVRWESALPIRAAEIRANEDGAPVLDGEDYAIAVYDIDLKIASPDPIGLAETLKKDAVLKIEGRKDVKPSRVALVQLGGNLITAIYLFPRSAHITLQDTRLTFEAQIGRVTLAQYFFPAEMTFQGRLEL
jgi:hypothetical protein